MSSAPPRRFAVADVIAGLTVTLVLVPQALAYAELAGLPPQVGLFAGALPPIAAAFFASSPYLQTGPTAVTSLLTGGALGAVAVAGSDDYVRAAALLALVVGVTRLALGLVRAGAIAYLMSQPVLVGFTSGAAVLIMASQLPKMAGVSPDTSGVIPRAWWALVHLPDWNRTSVLLSVGSIVAIVALRRVHRLFPGVLLVMIAAVAWSELAHYTGATIGHLPGDLPRPNLDLPLGELGALIVPGLVIAIVGFAEPTSIARTFAAAERLPWDVNRELVSQGVANITAGLTGGMPVGGSFARSALNRLAGAHSRWAGAITGLAMLAVLPLAPTIEALPLAVLGAVIALSAWSLFQPGPMLTLWRRSRLQGLVAVGTFAATIAVAPRVDRGVLIGIALSIGAHLVRELRVDHELELSGDTLTMRPSGVIWFATTPQLERRFLDALAEHPDIRRLVLDLSGVGRVDYSGAAVLAELVDDADAGGLEVEIGPIPDHAVRALAAHLGGRHGVPRLEELPPDQRHQRWRRG